MASGYEHDKIAEVGWTTVKAEKVNAPVINSAIAAASKLTLAAIFAKLHLFFIRCSMPLNGREQKWTTARREKSILSQLSSGI